MEKRIMIGIPVNRWLSPKFSISLSKVINYLIYSGFTVDINYDNGSVLSEQRNKLIQAAAKEDMDMLFIDSDMVFDQIDVAGLLTTRYTGEVISGLCFMRRFPFKPVIFSEDLVETEGVFRGMPFEDMPTYPFRCAATGCAFTLIKLDAIKRILDEYPYPFNNYPLPKGDVLGEDLSFMHRCNLLDLIIMCNPLSSVGHITERIVYQADHIAAMRKIKKDGEEEAKLSHLHQTQS